MVSTSKTWFQRALIVEDSAPIRKSMVRVASGWAREVIPAASVREAMAELAHAPDLLIADVELVDGRIFDVLESATWKRSRAVAVAVSGRASREDAFRLGQLGVVAFLWKPFGLRDFETLLAGLAARKPAQTPSPAPATPFESQLKIFARAHALTGPQTALLRALLCGASRRKLAATLGVSENTCKTTVRRLLARCQASRVADVVNKLMAQGVSANGRAQE